MFCTCYYLFAFQAAQWAILTYYSMSLLLASTLKRLGSMGRLQVHGARVGPAPFRAHATHCRNSSLTRARRWSCYRCLPPDKAPKLPAVSLSPTGSG